MRGLPGWRGNDDDRDDRSGHDGRDDWFTGGGNGRERHAFACLDAATVSRWSDPLADDCNYGEPRSGDEVQWRWMQMEKALKRLLAERPAGWDCLGQPEDLRGVAGMMHTGRQALHGGIDAVSLAAGSEHNLGCFRGLRDGIEKLGWS
jgi:hypothetical protein